MLKNRSRRFWFVFALVTIIVVILLATIFEFDVRVVRATELFGAGRMVSMAGGMNDWIAQGYDVVSGP